MLTRTELERLAPTLTRGNVGHAEKRYLQDIVLSTVSRETVAELVFKGGTALQKCYQLDRFSEDLDFTARSTRNYAPLVDSVVRDLENYGATVAERTADDSPNAHHVRLGLQGPLYTGERRSLCFIRIEINEASTVADVRNRRYTPPFPDLPSFDLAVLSEAEILAEKLRALLTRRQPRDLYDIYHLLQKSVSIEPALVQEKLDYYELPFDRDALIDAARELEPAWETLEPLVYSTLPPFEEAVESLERALRVTD